jgi:hypothetical protein
MMKSFPKEPGATRSLPVNECSTAAALQPLCHMTTDNRQHSNLLCVKNYSSTCSSVTIKTQKDERLLGVQRLRRP